jgi:hypothetical protein
MNCTIRENIEIIDVDTAIKNINYILKNENKTLNIDFEEIANFIRTQKSTMFFIDTELGGVSENNLEDAEYVWLDTGIQYRDKLPIFISLYNSSESPGHFEGFFVGTAPVLASQLIRKSKWAESKINQNCKKFMEKYEWKTADREIHDLMNKINVGVVNTNNTEIEKKRIEKEYENTPTMVTEDIRNQLMVYNWKTEQGLDRYIKIVGARILTLIKQKKEEYYIMNNIKSVVINTGLLNVFGVDIYVLYKYHAKYERYIAYKIIEGKNDIINEGFSQEQACKTIKPISFFDSKKYFEANIDDFDINYKALNHIIDERRDRFDESIKDIAQDTIAVKIQNALELGIKMQQRDRTYIKPIYNAKINDIAWVIPLYIFKSVMEEPELVLVVYRDSTVFWEVKTVLPYDDVLKDRIIDLSLYGNMW